MLLSRMLRIFPGAPVSDLTMLTAPDPPMHAMESLATILNLLDSGRKERERSLQHSVPLATCLNNWHWRCHAPTRSCFEPHSST